MVNFSLNEPMTSKNANNSSTAMFETNKVVAKLGTGMFYVFEAKKNQNDALLNGKCTCTQHLIF